MTFSLLFGTQATGGMVPPEHLTYACLCAPVPAFRLNFQPPHVLSFFSSFRAPFPFGFRSLLLLLCFVVFRFVLFLIC